MFMLGEYNEGTFEAFMSSNVALSSRQSYSDQRMSIRDMVELYRALERPTEREDVFHYFCGVF